MVRTVGIVGAGQNARDHAKACRAIGQVRLAAVCDTSRAALDSFGDEYGVSKLYGSLDDMLEKEKLDIVIVSTWGVDHARVSNAVARSRKVKAVLVEKPISSTAKECEDMIATARENGVLLIEGFKFRYHPQHRRTKQLIDSGAIGEIRAISSVLSSPLVRSAPADNWRFDRTRAGGSVFDTGSYLIHFARFLVGSEPEEVYALGGRPNPSSVELSASIVLSFPEGTTAALTSSYEYGYCQATSIVGTRGWIRMDLPFDQRSVREVEFVEKGELPATVSVFHDSFDVETYQFAPVSQFEEQLRHLCSCLERNAAPLITPEFSLGNMRVIEAAFQSMRTGQPVHVPAS